MKLNERIKEMRTLKNMTLLEVAEILGVKEATMQRYESGEIKNIKHDTVVMMADIFGCTPCYLMGWSDNKTENIQASSLSQQIAQEYGEDAAEFDKRELHTFIVPGEDAAAALSLYVQLDRTDRLRINERMQTLLEDEKYTSQKAKRGQSPA